LPACMLQVSSIFLHQSVGQDLEDGAEGSGFKFEYIDSSTTSVSRGLNGGLFSKSNGDPRGKVREWRKLALAVAPQLQIAIMKFGYADIVSDNLAIAQAEYQKAVADIKAAGVRVLHITPPLVYNAPDENSPKMLMRDWMISKFSMPVGGDVVFDLSDIESLDPSTGRRCERGGAWEICGSVRSTSGCPSQGQGVDAPSGQGHICYRPHAIRIAKALLLAVRQTAA
jgi:hypothetical protein